MPRVLQGKTRWLACIATICTLSRPTLAQSTEDQSLNVDLEYEGLAKCPDAAEFKNIVARRLGYDPFRSGARDRVLVFITPREPTIAGRIEWRDHDGKWTGDHTFPSRSNDCGELVRAMGFALALQIDLLAAARSAESPTEAAPHRHDEPAPSPVTTPPTPPTAPTTPPVTVNPVVSPRPPPVVLE